MKCIIFDCDGVLVDSEIITTKYFIKYLHDIGYQISIEDAIKRFTGISDKAVYEEISKASLKRKTPDSTPNVFRGKSCPGTVLRIIYPSMENEK